MHEPCKPIEFMSYENAQALAMRVLRRAAQDLCYEPHSSVHYKTAEYFLTHKLYVSWAEWADVSADAVQEWLARCRDGDTVAADLFAEYA